MGRQGLKQRRVAGQRMARHVEPKRLFLAAKKFGVGQLGDVGKVERGGMAVPLAGAIGTGWNGRLQIVEQPALAAAAVVLLGLPCLDGARQDRQKLRPPGPQAIEGPRPDQRFRAAATHITRRDPLEELVQTVERTSLLAGLHDRLDRLDPNPLDRAQPEVDLPLVAHPECHPTLVDVGRVHLDSHPSAILDMFNKELIPLGAVHLRGQHGRHVFGRVVGFQVGGLVRHHRVGRGVGLVEAVAAEVDDQIEDL